MGKALFVGLSAAFFTAYSLIATALFVPTDTITPIGLPGERCEDAPLVLLPSDPCYAQEASRIPFIGDFLAGLSNALEVAGNIFSGFFQLLTFQTENTGASVITLMIFMPLGFVNAFIIFGAIRGSG
jgi:hypothetical protein